MLQFLVGSKFNNGRGIGNSADNRLGHCSGNIGYVSLKRIEYYTDSKIIIAVRRYYHFIITGYTVYGESKIIPICKGITFVNHESYIEKINIVFAKFLSVQNINMSGIRSVLVFFLVYFFPQAAISTDRNTVFLYV